MKAVYDCEIIDQTEVSPGVYRTRLTGPEIAREATAGQFVNVRVARTTDPLLRRPFSVHATSPDEGVFSLLYVVIGRGTELLRRIPAGEKVSVVGPLGRGFDLGDSPDAEHVVVAGGCGAAPLHFLCDALCAKWSCEKVTVLAGAKSKDAVLCESEFRAHGVDVGIATDDASYGYGGLVTSLLEQHLTNTQHPTPNTRVYSCGPHAMMREVARICREAGVASCQVSLENNMACGLGVCMGCAQKVVNSQLSTLNSLPWHYERVCKDGPVFNAEDVIWE
jgi:dihydroorotate dehydrogenase electron transfer subunit